MQEFIKQLKLIDDIVANADTLSRLVIRQRLAEVIADMEQALQVANVSGAAGVSLPPLPTDEEIRSWAKAQGYYGHCTAEYHEGLEEGAAWMRTKAEGGNDR